MAADGTLIFVAAPVFNTVVLTTGEPYDTFVFCAGNCGSKSDRIVEPLAPTSPRYSPSFASEKLVCNSAPATARFLLDAKMTMYPLAGRLTAGIRHFVSCV